MGGLWLTVLFTTTLAAAPAPVPSAPAPRQAIMPDGPVPGAAPGLPPACVSGSPGGRGCVASCVQFVAAPACRRYPDVTPRFIPLVRAG